MTPEAPSQGDQPGGKEPGGEKPDSKSRSGDPKGTKESDLPAQNSGSSPPKPGSQGEPSATGTPVEKWGELPPHVRDVFRAQGGGDLPAPYRDWIDAYYRRLSKRSGS